MSTLEEFGLARSGIPTIRYIREAVAVGHGEGTSTSDRQQQQQQQHTVGPSS